jgi:glycosyltransferase involved in cell wall biosynthesis
MRSFMSDGRSGEREEHAGGSPRVTVVIPAYNAAWSIRRTLLSVLAQTYADIEIIVVDDGSTDGTVEIVESFARRDARIRLVRQRNGGVAAARNRGVGEGRGVYIAPIDADDIWLPENLERQVAALEAAGPATPFSFACFFRIDEYDRVVPRPRHRRPPPSDYIGLLRRNWVGCGSAAVFRKEAVLAAGGYDESLRARNAQGAEDWKLILTMASRAPGVSLTDRLIGYRVSPGAMSMNMDSMMTSVLLVIEEMQRSGPKIAAWHFWAARGSMLIWLLPGWVYARQWRRAGQCLAGAYLDNPLWFVQPVAWRMLFRILRKALIRSWLKPRSPWGEAAPISRPEDRPEETTPARGVPVARVDPHGTTAGLTERDAP